MLPNSLYLFEGICVEIVLKCKISPIHRVQVMEGMIKAMVSGTMYF